jgi:hypothetical protein
MTKQTIKALMIRNLSLIIVVIILMEIFIEIEALK